MIRLDLESQGTKAMIEANEQSLDNILVKLTAKSRLPRSN